MNKLKFLVILFLLLIVFNYTISLSNDTLVYIDDNGIDTKYHRLNCSFIPKNYHSITV